MLPVAPTAQGLIFGGLVIAALHAILPNHWLPFVLAARAQRWSLSRTLGILAVAGGLHVAVTVGLGALVVLIGIEVGERLAEATKVVVGAMLIIIGLVYGLVHRGGDHRHGPLLSGRATAATLTSTLLLSPCEVFLPLYLLASPHGWLAFAALSGVFALATWAAMFILVTLAFLGVQRLRMHFFERHQGPILGGLLVLMGVLVVTIGH